jgi:S-adenosylmethionine:tRNA ribosyltransferase-isomerase
MIPSGDVLVINDTKVFPARLVGKKKETGGKVDLLLLSSYEKPLSLTDPTMSAGEADEWKSKVLWKCLVQPALKQGQTVIFSGETAEAVFLKRDLDGVPIVEFKNTPDPRELAGRIGHVPLPPYIKREDGQTDQARYQTVYATNEGAVAAPTAGLHFTEVLLGQLRNKGVEVVTLTLHVGYGTFKPVENVESHRMHSEYFELSQYSADKINSAKEQGRKIWAVGTTTVRTLETCVQSKKLIAGKGKTNIFIRDPFEFEVVDRLITNFHLPKTTLLLLVGAFMGADLLKKTYEHAIRERYRFYSYGDAMLVL